MWDDIIEVVAEFMLELFGDAIEEKIAQWKEKHKRKRKERAKQKKEF